MNVRRVIANPNINRGGQKFFPREVEEVLYKLPKVMHMAIVGIADPRLGELRQLRYALAVAKERGFSRAATRLNVSQS